MSESQTLKRGQWFVLVASFLGWMFDGMEMGLFPLVARPALQDLLNITNDAQVAQWNSVIVACFLLGASIGGIVFGLLGDKIGRVRAMVVSILTYSLFMGACYFATAAWHLGMFLFLAALGMGGQWSLAVALIVESWPERHRSKMAGALGSASYLGIFFIAMVGLSRPITLTSWRWLMLVGAAPALLAVLIAFVVPESERWKAASKKGGRSPLIEIFRPGQLRKTLMAILLTGIPLIGTWAAIAGWTPLWAEQMAQEQVGRELLSEKALVSFDKTQNPKQRQEILDEMLSPQQWQQVRSSTAYAKVHVLIIFAICSAISGFLSPIIIGVRGRRPAYFYLCFFALLSGSWLYLFCESYDIWFMIAFAVLSLVTGAFNGWAPLYLPELFPTRIRATGQGLSFNAGRAIAACGCLFMGQFVGLFDHHYGHAAATICLIYGFGMIVIWFAPETKGKPLPE